MSLFLNTLTSMHKFKAFAPQPIRIQLDKLECSQIGQRLARGAFWSLLGALLSRGLNMASMIVLARLLGKNEFGEIGVIQSTVGIFQTLAGFGLGWAATRYVAKYRATDLDRAGRIISLSNIAALITGGSMAIIFFIAAPWVANSFLAAPHLAQTLQISSLILLFSTLAGAQNGSLAGFEAFRSIARINLYSGILAAPLIIGGGVRGGVEGAVWGIVASTAATCLLNYKNLRNEAFKAKIPITWKGCWGERRILWDFGLPSIIAGTSFNFGTWITSVMLVNSVGGYGEMGHYNAANQWFSALLFLPSVLGQASVPVLSEQIGNNNVERSLKILRYSNVLNAVIMFPLIILGSMASPWIMSLYGKDFKMAWATLVATLVAAGICALQSPSAQVITSSGRMWMSVVMNISWAVVFILGTVLLLGYGSLGVAISRCIAYAVFALWSFKFSISLLNCMPLDNVRKNVV